jgi:hypothetical protein
MSILAGTASKNGVGRHIALTAGGALTARDGPLGPVQVAVAPWNLEPATTGIEDTVTAVRRRGDRWHVTTERLALELPASDAPPPPGARICATASSQHLHVFPRAAES